jgi:hypothetical protein
MKTLEQYIALSVLDKPINNNLDILGIKEEEGIVWLLFTYKGSKKTTYKINMGLNAWSDLTTMYQTYIWSDMLSKGYLLINIEGGSLVISPNCEEYQLSDEACTCSSFLQGVNKSGTCKHIMFREGELSYRRRKIEYTS